MTSQQQRQQQSTRTDWKNVPARNKKTILEKSKNYYEGILDIDGIDATAKLIRILAGLKTDEYDKYNDSLIAKGRDFRLREMKRMSIQDLNSLYNHLDFLLKLINDILPVLDKEADTRERQAGIFEL